MPLLATKHHAENWSARRPWHGHPAFGTLSARGPPSHRWTSGLMQRGGVFQATLRMDSVLEVFLWKTSRFQGFPAHSIHPILSAFRHQRAEGHHRQLPLHQILLCATGKRSRCVQQSLQYWKTVSALCFLNHMHCWLDRNVANQRDPKKVRKTGNRLRSERKDWWTKKWMWKNN